MSKQMLKMKLQHLTNMGNWETGKHVQYVQCAVDTVQYMQVRQNSTYSSTVRAVMSQFGHFFWAGVQPRLVFPSGFL